MYERGNNIREEKNLKQIEVATNIGVDIPTYSKIEKGLCALSVDEFQKMAQRFNMTTDQVLGYDGKLPEKVVIKQR